MAPRPRQVHDKALIRVSMDAPSIRTDVNQQKGNDFLPYLNTQAGMFRSPLVLSAALREPGVSSVGMIRDQGDPIKNLQDELLIETKDGSELITLKLPGDDPKGVALVLNAIIDAYYHEVIQDEIIRKKARLDALKAIIAKSQQEVEKKYEDSEKVKVEPPIAGMEPSNSSGRGLAWRWQPRNIGNSRTRSPFWSRVSSRNGRLRRVSRKD